MKPLPAQNATVIHASESAASPCSTCPPRVANGPSHRVYACLLFISTSVAALFCLMYITKPFIQASKSPISTNLFPPAKNVPPPVPVQVPASANVALMPTKKQLPSQKITTPQSARNPVAAFEQTNLRIQHILTAETPGGDLSKIDIDVPVLYRSRNLRWTAAEVTEARALLVRLADYQEKSQSLRAEGAELLDSWNRVIERSIPASELRADSPTLPTNQQDAADAPRPVGLNTTELIKIQPAGK